GSTNPFGRQYLIAQPMDTCTINTMEAHMAMPQAITLQHCLNGILNNNCHAGHVNALWINRLCSDPVWRPIVDSGFATSAVPMENGPTMAPYRLGVSLNAVPGNALPNVVNNYVIVTPELLKNASKEARENFTKKTDFQNFCNEIVNCRINTGRGGNARNNALKNMPLKSQTSDEIDEIVDNLNADDRKLIAAFMEKYPEVPEHVVIALLPSLKKQHPKRNSTSPQEPRYAEPYNNFENWMSCWTHRFPMWQQYQQYYDHLYKQYQLGSYDRSPKQNEDHSDNSDESYHRPSLKMSMKPMTDIHYENILPIREAFTYKTHIPDKQEILKKNVDSEYYKMFVPRGEIKARYPKNEVLENILVSKVSSEPKAANLKNTDKTIFLIYINGTPKYKKRILESRSGQSELGHEYKYSNNDNRNSDKENCFNIERNMNVHEMNRETQPYNHIKDTADRNFARYEKEESSIENPKKSDIEISEKSKNIEPENIMNDLSKYDDSLFVDSSKSKYPDHKYNEHKSDSEKSGKLESVTAVTEKTEKSFIPLSSEEVGFETKLIKGQKNEANLRKSEDKTISYTKSMDRMTRESITKPTLVETVEARSKVVKYPSYLESENAERVSSVEEIVGNLKAEKPQDEKKYIVVAETASDLDEFWRRRGRTRRFK
ncbi:hypothetical protein EVAR_100970_1, partial [Eumeta japonica]